MSSAPRGGGGAMVVAADDDIKLAPKARTGAMALAPGTTLAPWQVYGLIILAPATGIGLILANKALMQGFSFSFPGLLVALHFTCNAVVLTSVAKLGMFEERGMPTRDRLLLGLSGALAIVLGTMSLRINSLGAFLATNMLTTPATVLLRYLWEGKRYSLPVLGALSLVVAGVALHTLTDKDLHAGWGLPVALVSVSGNAAYQVLQKMRQDSLRVHSAQLIQQISPVVAAVGGLLALTEARGEGGFAARDWGAPLLAALLLTAVMAVAANVSGGALIGVTSPVTFQVMGYVKTCLLFVVSVAWAGASGGDSGVAVGSAVGVPLALCGAVMYGRWVKG